MHCYRTQLIVVIMLLFFYWHCAVNFHVRRLTDSSTENWVLEYRVNHINFRCKDSIRRLSSSVKVSHSPQCGLVGCAAYFSRARTTEILEYCLCFFATGYWEWRKGFMVSIGRLIEISRWCARQRSRLCVMCVCVCVVHRCCFGRSRLCVYMLL